MFSHSTIKKMDLKTSEGRFNILEAIIDCHTNLNNLQAIDTSMSAVTAIGLFLMGADVPYSLVITACSDAFMWFSMRNSREKAYQDSLALLIRIYSESLLQGGVRVTADPLFLKLMATIAPNLTKEQGKEILTPAYLKSEYADISSGFKAILAKAPHNREIELVSLPKKKGWLDYLWYQEPASKVEQPSVDVKKADDAVASSWADNIHTSAVWCKLYGHKPKTVDAKPVMDLKSVVSSVKSMALQQLAKNA